eukprot:365052-Chlamydomonas_euryale.AAC.2
MLHLCSIGGVFPAFRAFVSGASKETFDMMIAALAPVDKALASCKVCAAFLRNPCMHVNLVARLKSDEPQGYHAVEAVECDVINCAIQGPLFGGKAMDAIDAAFAPRLYHIMVMTYTKVSSADILASKKAIPQVLLSLLVKLDVHLLVHAFVSPQQSCAKVESLQANAMQPT